MIADGSHHWVDGSAESNVSTDVPEPSHPDMLPDGRAALINQTLILTTGSIVADNNSYTLRSPVTSLPSVLAPGLDYEFGGPADFDRPENYNKGIFTGKDDSTQLSDYTTSAGQETRLGDYITSDDRNDIAMYARIWGLD
jgi:hypothetical protein